MFEITPVDSFNVPYGRNIQKTLDISNAAGSKTISSYTMTITDTDDADVTTDFSLDSSESSKIITFGIKGYAAGTYLIKFLVTYTDTAPDTTALTDIFYITFTVSEAYSLTSNLTTNFYDLYMSVIKQQGLSTTDDELKARIKESLNDNYKILANRYDWRWLYEAATIATTAKYDTGTVSVTEGSATVTGSGTTFTSAMVGRKFKVDGFDEIYTISAYSSATSITLDNEFNGDTDSGLSYDIFQDLYSLPSNCEHLISIRQFMSPAKLKLIGLREMRRLAPLSDLTDTDPEYYAYYEADSSMNQQIVLYPPPYRQIVLDYTYKLLVVKMMGDTDEPLIPENYRYILKYMAMADIYANEKDDNRYSIYIQKSAAAIREFAGKYALNDDYKRLVPENKRSKTVSLQELANKFDLGDNFDRL